MNKRIKNKYVIKGNDDQKPSVYTINDEVVDFRVFYSALTNKMTQYMNTYSDKFIKVQSDVNLEVWIELAW